MPAADELPDTLRLLLRTSQPMMGAQVLGEDERLELIAIGAKEPDSLMVLIDDAVAEVEWRGGADGVSRASLQLRNMARGAHSVVVIDRSGDRDRSSVATLLVPSSDDHLGQPAPSAPPPADSLPEEEDDGSEDWSQIALPRSRWKGGALED